MSQHVEDGFKIYSNETAKSKLRCAVKCHRSESCAGYSYEENLCITYRPACSLERVETLVLMKIDAQPLNETGNAF